LRKVSEKTLSVLLTLMITLPLMIIALPIGLNPPLVKAASATITLTPTQGYVGDYVTVAGSGFKPAKDIIFTWGNQLFASLGFIGGMPYRQRPSIYTSGGEVRTDALGNFIVQLQVPKLTRGTYTIEASDTENSATASFAINPLIKLRNEYAYETHGSVATPVDYTSGTYYIDLFLDEGFVYDRLGLQLSGFGRGETVEINMGTKEIGEFIVGTASTTEGYLFDDAAARVPNIPGGEYNVTATGLISGIVAWTIFTIKPELFLAAPPPSLPPPPGLPLAFPWLHAYSTMGLGWYTSIGTSVDSAFVFEATGLTGTSISSISIVYSGGTAITCTLSGTLTLQTGTGATQGINVETSPYTAPRSSNSPFGANSPVAKIPSTLTDGKMLNVTITTVGAGAASFTFTNQLFSSTAGTSDTGGTLRWVEGDSTISSDGTSLSGFGYDVDKIAITGLRASAGSLVISVVYSTGSTVQEKDVDALYLGGPPLTLYDQSTTPVSFYDAVANSQWDADETVYVDNDNSGTVTANDVRVTILILGGTTFMPWSTVVGGNPDLGRALIAFPESTRPGLYSSGWYQWVVLDKTADSKISKGDTRITTILADWISVSSDLNGFTAATATILPNIPGDGGLQYKVGLWNRGVGSNGVQAGNTITMELMPSLTVTTPTRYQSTNYVTEGSSVTISGNNFYGNEPLMVSVGGKYVTTLTPTSYGVLSPTAITMPASAGGEQQITLQGIFTVDNTASIEVTYTPALNVNPTSGFNLNPVDSIAVTGKGFEAGTYNIIFDGAGIGQAVVTSITVTDTGDFAGQINTAFNLPEGVEGYHIVDVVKTSDPTKSIFYGASYFTISAGLRTGVSATYPYPTDSEFKTVLIKPSLQRTPTEAIVGTSTTVTGMGLKPSTTYYIWYDPKGTSTSRAVLMTTTPTTVTTNEKGTLTASFTVPISSGPSWDQRSIWVSTSPTFIDTDPILPGAVSTYIYIQPAMTLAQYSGTVGSTVAVSFTGLQPGAQYQLWWYKPEEVVGSWGQVAPSAIPLTTLTGAMYGNATGPVSFTVPLTAELGTVYVVQLTYYGSRSSEEPPPSFFTVGKVATRITLSCTPETITAGENATINGIIEPAMSVNITLFITRPDGTTENRTVMSTSSGTFTESFTATMPGTWQVKAQWDGNAVYSEYASTAADVTAKPVDMSWAYALTGLAIGIVALVFGIIIILYYMRKKRTASM